MPEVQFSLSEDQLSRVQQVLYLDPLIDDGNYGITHYCELLDYITSNCAHE